MTIGEYVARLGEASRGFLDILKGNRNSQTRLEKENSELRERYRDACLDLEDMLSGSYRIREKAKQSQDLLRGQLACYNNLPADGCMLYLDKRGVIRYASPQAKDMLGEDIAGGYILDEETGEEERITPKNISRTIYGTQEEREKTAQHFNTHGDGFVYVEDHSGKEIAVHITVRPETFPFMEAGEIKDVRYGTVIRMKRAPVHTLRKHLHLGKEFFQDGIRKELEKREEQDSRQ